MVARVVWDHEAAGSSPVTSTIGMRRRFIEICGASVIRYTLRAIPHNSKYRYGEQGAAAAGTVLKPSGGNCAVLP